MIRKFEINNMDHGARIAAHAGALFNPAHDQTISTTIDGELAGGVIYTAYNPAGSINMHMAGFRKNWVNTDMLWMAFSYPFDQLKVRKLFAQVPASNTTALEIDEKLGFKREAYIRDVFADDDLVVLSMYRDQCRWLGIKSREARGSRR